jgi:transcriptional regulator with PAS, ATPase and Fis domain
MEDRRGTLSSTRRCLVTVMMAAAILPVSGVFRGMFRQDLYYRINVFSLTILPLRQRKDDNPLTVRAFIKRFPQNNPD